MRAEAGRKEGVQGVSGGMNDTGEVVQGGVRWRWCDVE